MSRYSLVARLGKKDLSRVNILQKDSIVVEMDLLDGDNVLKYGMGSFINGLALRGMSPSETSIDLGILALLITAADTRISRESDAQDNWTREIDLYFPVENVFLWESVLPKLQRMLNFLTGDYWRLFVRIRKGNARKLAPVPESLRLREHTCVSLFSGGLDSFIGAIDFNHRKEKPLLISHYWEGIVHSYQQYLYEALKKYFLKNNIDQLSAYVGFPLDLIQKSSSEKSQRGRSFLFFALAVLAADSIGKGVKSYVPENGFISLNAPLTPLRLGSLSTRTTHPYYMALWNSVLKDLKIDTELLNPYKYMTKGEMFKECSDQKILKKLAKHTVSCSSINKGRFYGKPPMHCGYCVPCIIRQASFLFGASSDETKYRIPLNRKLTLKSRLAEGKHVHAFRFAIERIRKTPNIISSLVLSSGPLLENKQNVEKYIKIYSRGIKEAQTLLKNVSLK